jgi:hypothetical protein
MVPMSNGIQIEHTWTRYSRSKRMRSERVRDRKDFKILNANAVFLERSVHLRSKKGEKI